jgi:hypothetical protein
MKKLKPGLQKMIAYFPYLAFMVSLFVLTHFDSVQVKTNGTDK